MLSRTGIFTLTAVLFLPAFFPSEAFTAGSATRPESEARPTAGAEAPLASDGLVLFAGAGAGYGSVIGKDYQGNPGGGEYTLGASLIYQAPKWAWENGARWQYSRFGGLMPDGREVGVRIRDAIVETSWRWRLTPRFQLGPIAQMAFGADSDFEPVVGGASTNFFGGVALSYELGSFSHPVQLWAQGTTDLSFASRQLVSAIAGVRIGLPFHGRDSEPPHPTAVSAAESDAIHLGAAAPMDKHELRIVLDSQKVFFRTNSSQLRGNVVEALRDVGNYLKFEPGACGGIEVSGHADQRGAYRYNLKLSRRRAQSVRDALSEGGVAGSRLSIQAYSYLKPVDPAENASAWARNRRVEIVFHDVKDPAPLIRRLAPLMTEEPIR